MGSPFLWWPLNANTASDFLGCPLTRHCALPKDLIKRDWKLISLSFGVDQLAEITPPVSPARVVWASDSVGGSFINVTVAKVEVLIHVGALSS